MKKGVVILTMASDDNGSDSAEGDTVLGLSSLPISQHLLQRIVQKGLRVKCVEYDNGCLWEGSLVKMQDHVDEECRYFFVDCPNQCGVTGLNNKALQDHLSKQCQEAIVGCKYANTMGCKHRAKRKNMVAHETDAEKHFTLLASAMKNLKKENMILRKENKSLKLKSHPSESLKGSEWV